jgi:hypothetical protein
MKKNPGLNMAHKNYFKMRTPKRINYFIMLFGLITYLSACNNQSGNMNNSGLDSTGNGQMAKGVTVKERQRFHTQAQRSLDSLQRVIDNTGRTMKLGDNESQHLWDQTRDSLRKILDHANRTLNIQSYKSDDEWAGLKNTVNSAIDSAQSVLKRNHFVNN